MRGVADVGEPDLAVEHFLGDLFGLLPHVGLIDAAEIFALAGEGELASQMMILVLENDAADVMRIVAGEHTVHDDLRYRFLALIGFAARLEIDCLAQAFFRTHARVAVKAESLRRTFQPAGVVLPGDRLAAFAGRVIGTLERRKLYAGIVGRRHQNRRRAGCPALQALARAHHAAAKINRSAVLGGIVVEERQFRR